MRIRIVVTIVSILLASSAWAQWNVQTVDNSGNTGQKTSIAYDAQGYPHIGYSDAGGDAYHAFWTGRSWQIERVSDGQDVWSSPPVGLCIDDAGVIHMAYGVAGRTYNYYHYVSYRTKTDSGWQSAENIAGGYNFYGLMNTAALGVCLDVNGVPYVSYCDGSSLVCAQKSDSTWLTTTVDAAGSVGQYSSIVCDASGHVYIAYRDEGGTELKFAYNDGSIWSTQIVDMSADVGDYGVSIKLDGSGNPCIAYYDKTNGDLKYAKFTGNLAPRAGQPPAELK